MTSVAGKADVPKCVCIRACISLSAPSVCEVSRSVSLCIFPNPHTRARMQINFLDRAMMARSKKLLFGA